MKTAKRISAVLLTLLLVFALSISASALTQYEPVAGTSTTFDKYLVMDANANVPPVTFSYTIEAGTAIGHTETTIAVIAGPSPTAVTVGTATFTAADTRHTSLQSGDHLTLASGQAYAKKQVSIDFSGVSFSEPGVYRYILTESELTGASAYGYDVQAPTGATARQRTLDVYVTDNGSGTLVVSGYVLHTGLAAPSKTATETYTLDDKSYGFVNSYATQDLIFEKSVSGNQASRDKYFAFTVTISNATAGTKYTVDLSNATGTINVPEGAAGPNEATTCISASVTQPSELTIPEGATSVTQVYYLQDSQSITIRGLAKGTSYSITENAEDYVSSRPNGVSGTVADAAIDAIVFTNTRNGVVPTGIMLTVIPGVVIVVLAGVGLFLIARKKKDKD